MKTRTKRHLLVASGISALACLSMLVGTTYAWFTDSATVSVNKIQTGTLDIDLVDGSGATLVGKPLQFGDGANEVLWEPGATHTLQPVFIKNVGNLPVKYVVQVSGVNGSAELNKVMTWDITGTAASTLAVNATAEISITGKMSETAGNEYQGKSIDGIGITVSATQLKAPSNSSTDYKPGAGATLSGNGYTATIPSGATLKTEDGTAIAADAKLAMSIVENPSVDANITVKDGETATTYEISLTTQDGKTVSSTEPIEVKLFIGAGKTGTIFLYHNAEPVTGAVYDATTGYITFTATGFSPYTVVEVSKDALPKADVTAGSVQTVTGCGVGGSLSGTVALDTTYVFKTTETFDAAQAGRFANWHADFVVTVSQDVPAEAVTLAGSYSAFNDGAWVAFKNPDVVKNGQEIRLLKDVINQPVSYWELCKRIPEFKCGAAGAGVNGATMTVELRLYEANGGKFEAETGNYVTIGSYDYTFTK